jgi:hypothetical protein
MFIPVDLWFRAFLLTLAVEVPVAATFLVRWEPSRSRLVVLVVFANLASHPAVWFVFTQLLLLGTPTYVLVAEGWAIACEAVFYLAVFRGLPWRWAIGISVAANVASFLVGRLVVAVWPGLFT